MKKPTVDEIVESERLCLLNRGFPLFLNQKEIREQFHFGEDEIRRVMATKTPVISGRYTLQDVLYAIHGA